MNQIIWRIAQAAFIIWATVDIHEQMPHEPIGMHFFIAVLICMMLTVLLSNGYGLLCRLWARVFARVPKEDQARGDSLSLTTVGRGLRENPQKLR